MQAARPRAPESRYQARGVGPVIRRGVALVLGGAFALAALIVPSGA
jgi:hypothetical protein